MMLAAGTCPAFPLHGFAIWGILVIPRQHIALAAIYFERDVKTSFSKQLLQQRTSTYPIFYLRYPV